MRNTVSNNFRELQITLRAREKRKHFFFQTFDHSDWCWQKYASFHFDFIASLDGRIFSLRL